MRYLICIVGIILLLFSCKKDRLIGDKKILVGTWNWHSSLLVDECLGWTEYTPENTGKTNKVVFTKKRYYSILRERFTFASNTI
jgi:hypothetical protein